MYGSLGDTDVSITPAVDSLGESGHGITPAVDSLGVEDFVGVDAEELPFE